MPGIEIHADSTAMDYCFACDTPTAHNGAFVRWEDGSLEDVCCCTVCKSIHRSVLDEHVPHINHQAVVHEIAKKYLNACAAEDRTAMKEVTDEFRRPVRGAGLSRKGFLFYLEVLEEAMVLHANDPTQWSMDEFYVTQMQKQCAGVRNVVTAARNGRPRQSTTPTLPGGRRRGSAKGRDEDGQGTLIPILAVRPLLPQDGHSLVERLLDITDLAAGINLIDESRDCLDDHFFDSMKEHFLKAKNNWLEVDRAHRIAVWRLHATSKYYHIKLQLPEPPAYQRTILDYEGDAEVTIESLMFLADAFERVSQYQPMLRVCADAYRISPSPARKIETAIRYAKLLRITGQSRDVIQHLTDAIRSLAGLISDDRLSELVREQARAHLVLREFDNAIDLVRGFASEHHSREVSVWTAQFQLEASLVRQLREIADGILADMILNPDYYEQVWSDYGPPRIWWSYFGNCFDIAPEIEPEEMAAQCKAFEEQFTREVATGEIVSLSPIEIMHKTLTINGQGLRFVNFEETNALLRACGSRKRLIVQDMLRGLDSRGQPICEFIFGDIDISKEFEPTQLSDGGNEVLQFHLEGEDVVCPTMTHSLEGLNGGYAYGHPWIAVRGKQLRRKVRDMMTMMTASLGDSEDG